MTYPPLPGGPPYQPPPGGGPGPGPFGGQQPWPQQQWAPGPQQQWAPGPPPKKRGNGWKWVLGAVALLVVIGVTAAVTISVTSDGSGDDSTPSANDFGLASAGDDGPVNVILEDPSCGTWSRVQTTLADSQSTWSDRDPSVPATSWTPEQRSAYTTVAEAMNRAANQTVQLVSLTPHRVVRELYEQFIAYARAYSAAIPSYEPEDDNLAGVVTASSAALGFMCGAITQGSAQSRGPLIATPQPPSEVSELTEPDSPTRFLQTSDPVCREWGPLLEQFTRDSSEWQALDASIPASDWTVTQRAAVDAVIPKMEAYADELERLGKASENPIFEDFATFAAQYRRAYAEALPTYGPSDSYLSRTSAMAASTVFEACSAVGD